MYDEENWYEESSRTEARQKPKSRKAGRRRKQQVPMGPVLLLLGVLAAGFLMGWFLRGWVLDSSPDGGTSSGNAAQTAEKEPPENPDWVRQDFLPKNPYSRPGTTLVKVNGIVVHYVGNPGTTAEQNHSYFAGLAKSKETYASSHFLVGLDGEIIQNIPLDEIAYCSNSRNEDTIAIECCHPDDQGQFNAETYDSLVKLVKWLEEYYGLAPEQVIRHYDVTGKECPVYYVRNPEAWETFLADIKL